MTARLTEIAFDCADPDRLAEFWCAALDYVVVDTQEGLAEIAPAKVPDADLVEAFRHGPADPSLIFIRVPEGKSAKNRLHLDISPIDCTHAEEVARMESLGARKADLPRGENQSWTVMLDPEDNEFCVLRSLAPGEFSLLTGHPGHSVLQVPVPELEEFVRARTIHHDASYLAADPAFVHAHVTALGPFADELTDDAERRIAAIAADTPPFDFVLASLGRFTDGTLHLLAEPDDRFRELTARLAAEFPEHPPYGGAFDPIPHLTLDLLSAEVTEESTLALLGEAVPARCRAERLDLVWYEPGATGLRRSWQLG